MFVPKTLRKKINDFFSPPIVTNKKSFTSAPLMRWLDLEIWGVAPTPLWVTLLGSTGKRNAARCPCRNPTVPRERGRIQGMWRSLLGRNQTTQYQPDSGPTWQTLGVSNKNKQCSSVLSFHDLFPDLLAHTKLFHTISAVKQKSNYVVGQLRIPVNYIRRCNHNQVIGCLSQTTFYLL